MKIWNKGENFSFNKKIEEFTSNQDSRIDLLLAPYDVIGTVAHIIMLNFVGLLKDQELILLIKELRIIYNEILKNKFSIELGIEDIHSQIELILIKRLGDIGKKIHSGRSRNDQILLDIKLFVREKINEIVKIVFISFNLLLNLSEKYKKILMPGYTHYQIAMPSSFGLWFAAYAESFIDDLLLLETSYRIVNKNPLGSAAGYGSSFPLNRQITTNILGFEDLNYNAIYAQMGRGKMEKIVSDSISSLAKTLSKISQDICLFSNKNFEFISFPEHLTTGSSIMPHKNNPDVFELIRAKCNRIISFPNEISLISSNLSSGYHRDFQIIKERFLPIFYEIQTCFSIFNYMLKNIIVKKDILKDKKYKYLSSVEHINYLVINGYSFRDAYKKVGKDIKNNNFKPFKEKVLYSHEGSIGNLCNKQIKNIMNNIVKKFDFNKFNNIINRLIYKKINTKKKGLNLY